MMGGGIRIGTDNGVSASVVQEHWSYDWSTAEWLPGLQLQPQPWLPNGWSSASWVGCYYAQMLGSGLF